MGSFLTIAAFGVIAVIVIALVERSPRARKTLEAFYHED